MLHWSDQTSKNNQCLCVLFTIPGFNVLNLGCDILTYLSFRALVLVFYTIVKFLLNKHF